MLEKINVSKETAIENDKKNIIKLFTIAWI